MADLTRFDFHAKRFYFSENVRVMSAEEVGQYLLLLVESWMGGKDASLPDNPALLARYARVQQVSENVLAMFPLVETQEHGTRRQNETLFDEWSKAMQRVEEGRNNAAKRADRQNPACQIIEDAVPQGTLVGTQRVPNTTRNGILLTQAKPNITKPGLGQPGPESEPSPESFSKVLPIVPFDSCSPIGAVAPNPTETNFKSFRITWRQVVGKKLASNKLVIEKYEDACAKFGEEKVSNALREWATGSTLKWAKEANFPFAAFIKQLPETLEAMVDDLEEETTLTEVQPVVYPVHDVPEKHINSFQTFKARWQHLIGPLPIDAWVISKYKTACDDHTPAAVLEAFEKWATEKKVRWAQGVAGSMAFGVFMKNLPYAVEAPGEDKTKDPLMEQAEALVEAANEQPKVTSAEIDASIEKQAQQEQAERAARAARFSKTVEESAGSMEEYL